MAEQTYRVEMKNICKAFGGVHALSDVHLQIAPGEIHALMGENGAGKSTMIKILSGAHCKDSGEIFLDGERVEIHNPKDGANAGVAVIYQEFALVPHLTVAENIFIDQLGRGKRFINWKQLRKSARDVLDDLGFNDISETAIVSELSIAYQQAVEIIKALSKNARVLVLDEPTALLTNKEVIQLFRLIRELKEKKNVSIIYVSHRLEEIFELCDKVTVFKDGTYVNTVNIADINKEQLVSLMIGREMQGYFPERHATIGEEVFSVSGLNNGKMVQDVKFSVRSGEILGFGGLVGAGRTETMRAIVGADKKESGTIKYKGNELKINTPRDAYKNKIGFLPEDRKNQGVLLELPIRYNTTMSCLDNYTGLFNKLNTKEEIKNVTELTQKMNLKCASINALVKSLSGGNQQKVTVSKLLASECEVLIFDEPTRGVDVGAKREIYSLINSLAEQGNAVIIVSSEMTELIGMCDRVLVMRNGRIVGELAGNEMEENNLIKFAMGVNESEAVE